jgi:hypothetical protein
METVSTALPAYLPAPLAAPGISEYPQFVRTTVPPGSGAMRAWTGIIQPFIDHGNARRFLTCVESSSAFDIVRGTIYAESAPGIEHWADSWLVRTDIRFRLLVLEFGGSEHPRAYALQPEISYHSHPMHPHLRVDRTIHLGPQRLPALCVYSGAEFVYSPAWPRIVQFLDQVSTFLARHIIWLRTRTPLPERYCDRPRRLSPGEFVFDAALGFNRDAAVAKSIVKVPRYAGYWPGAAAPCGAQQHLRTILPTRECWCWSGRPYADCHRKSDRQIANRRVQ